MSIRVLAWPAAQLDSPAAVAPQVAVVQVTWSLASGGSERYAVDLASALDSSHYSIHLCALDSGGELEADARKYDIPFTIMHRPPRISLTFMWRVYQFLRQKRPNVVHTHHFAPLLYSAVSTKLVGARLIHTEHGLGMYDCRRRRLALRLLSTLCSSIVAVGTESARFLREQVGIPAGKLSVIPGGIRTDQFVGSSRTAARRVLGLRDVDRVAVIVARLSAEKNHRLLLNAFREVSQRVENACLLIVGEGSERSAISTEISRLGLENCVRLLGLRRDIPRILAASDVFLLSSNEEGLPIAVLEAMASGLPIVATDVGDLCTVIEQSITGRLVPAGDIDAFAQATIDILADSAKAQVMGREARRRVTSFSVRNMAERYQGLYTGGEEVRTT